MRFILIISLLGISRYAYTQAHIEPIKTVPPDSLEALRQMVKNELFGPKVIPALIMDSSGANDVTYDYMSTALKGYRRGTVSLENGFKSRITLFTPLVSNGLNIPIIYHTGHGYGIFLEDDFVNDRGIGDSAYRVRVVDYFLQRGYEVIGIDMPMTGSNTNPDEVIENGNVFPMQGHDDIFYLQNPFYYFLAPIQSAIDYYQVTHDCDQFVMLGLSGGGWSTTLYSAIDPRIILNFSIGGSIPISLRLDEDNLGDLEQYYPGLYDNFNYSTFYYLDAAGKNRLAYQILIEKDNCCFAVDGNNLWAADINHALEQSGVDGKFEFYYDRFAPYHKISSVAVDSISYHIIHDLANPKLKQMVHTRSSRANNTICDNDTVALTVTAPGESRISWYKDGLKKTTESDSLFVAYAEGTYYPLVTNLSGASVRSDSIFVLQKKIFQTPVITRSGDFLETSYAPLIQWYFNGTLIQEKEDRKIPLKSPGRFTVRLIDGNCKSDFSQAYDYGISLFPNPARAQVTLRLPTEVAQLVNYNIMTSNGKVLRQGRMKGENTINVSGLPTGLYLIKIWSATGFEATQKFWKQ